MDSRLVLAVLALSFVLTDAKVFTRCQLTRELLKNNFQRTFLSNWVCLIEQESDRNTAALVTKSPRRKYYGLFQIGSEWCKEGKKGGKCDITCEGVCLIEQESDRNTAALVTKSPRRKYYGLFQIGSEWCKEGKKGGKCDITCEALLDDDIRDDGVCAQKVFDQEGFKYWTKWDARCKGHVLPDIEKCPDWQFPPSRSSVSPSRDKRRVKRSVQSKKLRSRKLLTHNKSKNWNKKNL